MKHSIVSVCLAIVLAGGTLASASEEGLYLGVRGGTALNMFSVDGYPDFDAGLGYGGGVAFKYVFTEWLAIASEVSLIYREVGRYEQSQSVLGLNVKVQLSVDELALSVPVMLQFEPIEDVPLYIAAGAQLEIPFGTKLKLKTPIGSETADLDERASFDFGVAAGIGYMVLPYLGVDFRYTLNLTKPADYGGDIKSSFMSFGLGVTCYFIWEE